MTTSVITGLLIQFVALWLMHVGIRGRWMSHIGAIFLVTAVFYHGITELIQLVFPGYNAYRKYVTQDSLDNWMLIASSALFVYTVAYVFVWRRSGPEHVDSPPVATGYFGTVKLWWVCVPVVPLLVLTVIGGGASYSANGPAATGSAYVAAGLAGQYLVPLTGLAGTVAVAKHGARWILPVLLSECLILAMAGDRRSIVFATVITLYGLSLTAVKLPRKQLAVGLCAAVLLVFSISASRAVLGREAFWAGEGADSRSTALVAGGDALADSQGWEGVKKDTVYRLDGNSFGILVDTEITNGVAPVGLTTLWNTLRLPLPSFLWPEKNTAPLEIRNEEVYLQRHFAIGSTKDFIPGMVGTLIGYYGRAGLMILLSLLGAAFAAVDISVRRRRTPVALALGSAMAYAALLYEQGPPGLVVSARGAVVLAGLTWLTLRLARRRRDAVAAATTPESRSALGSRPVSPPSPTMAGPSAR
jgi:hypothetical protein